MAKTALLLLLAVSLVIQSPAAIPASASETDEAYKAAYYALIKELHKADEFTGGFDRYALIYLDDDDVPELLAVDTPSDEYDNNGTYVYELFTYYDGKAVKLGNYASGVASAGGYRGNTMYIKKSGKIYETYISSGSGNGGDIVAQLKDGEMVELGQGTFNIESDTSIWNGKTVSNKKYTKSFNKLFKTKKAKSFEDVKTITYSKMRKKLK